MSASTRRLNECIHNNAPIRITSEHKKKKYEIWIEVDHEKKMQNIDMRRKRKKSALKEL